MAKPTAVTELGGSKVLLLADSTAITPAAKTPAAIEVAPSGEGTYPVGWIGVATHRQGQALTGAGGFTTVGTGPVALVAGLDTATVRAVAVDSSGRIIVAGDGTGVGVDTNPIAGQVGVQGNSGVVTALTQRVVLATDVALPSIAPGYGATNLGKREDDIHSTLDVGVMALAVRKDTKIALAGTDGDYIPLIVNADGALHVDTGGGGGTSYADDAAFTVGASQVNPIGGILSADTIDAGDTGAVGMTAQREMRVQLGSAGTAVPIGAGVEVNTLRVTLPTDCTGVLTVKQGTAANLKCEATLAAAQTLATVTTVSTLTGTTTLTPGTGATNLGKAEDAVHASGDVGVMALGVRNDTNASYGADGDYCPQAVDSGGNQKVVGNIAHDGVDAGNPVKIGGKGVTSVPAAVSSGDRVDAYFDLNGRQVVKIDTAIPVKLAGFDQSITTPKYGALTTAVNSTAVQTLLTNPSAGRYHISSVTISGYVGTAARTVTPKLYVKIGFGTAGTLSEEIARIYMPNISGEGFTYNLTFPTPIRGGTDGHLLYAQASAATENTGEWTATATATEGT
jgi:hypothetical protein